MTYTEWRDELKNNLLSVSESERSRVLEYYAEAYADRREAGFSEREIIAEFGAPYDAAQRILNEDDREPNREEGRTASDGAQPVRDEYFSEQPSREGSGTDGKKRKKKKGSESKKQSGGKTSWVFILLCIIFAIPILWIVIALSAITFAAFVAPFAVLIAGIGVAGLGVGIMFASVLDGLMHVGVGLILFGVGIILISILPRIAKLFWILFKKIGGFIKSLFTKEEA